MPTVVRDGTEDDIPDVIRLSEEYHGLSRFSDTPISGDYIRMYLHRLIDLGGIFKVAEADGDVVGFMTADESAAPWSGEPIIGSTHLFATPRHKGAAGLKLLRELKAEAERRGAARIVFSWMSGWRDDRIMDVLSRMGYVEVGRIAVAEVR